jgi:hypothetical protein
VLLQRRTRPVLLADVIHVMTARSGGLKQQFAGDQRI